jgi:tetratricopeptide (TPR) repeat protein
MMSLRILPHSTYTSRSLCIIFSILICFFSSSCRETPEEISQRRTQQGDQYFAAKEYTKALAVWDELVALQPDAPNIYKKIGETNIKLANYDKALQAFQNFVRLQPNSWETWLTIAQLQLTLFNIAEAELCWEKIKDVLSSPEAKIFHGDLLAAKRKFPEASLAYQEALSTDPNSQKALARLALTYLGQNKNELAQKTLSTLEKLNPQSDDIKLQLADYWILYGDPDKAEKYIRNVVEKNPDDLEFHFRLAEFYLDSSHFDQAITIFDNISQKNPDNRFFKKMLVETLLLNDDTGRAGEILENLSDHEGNDLDFLLLKGKYHLINLAYNTAVSQFQAVLGKEPKLPMAHYLLSLAYLAGGQSQQGQKSLVKCLTLNPDFSEAELTLADFYYKNGDYDLAMEHSGRIREREPENYRAHLIIGNIHLARHEYLEAIADYRTAQALNPDLASTDYFMAFSWQLQDQQDKALSIYRELIMATKPVLADTALRYSHLLANKGKVETAIPFLKDAIRKDPENPYLYYVLGECFLTLGNKADAITTINQALSINSHMKSAYQQLFNLYQADSKKLEELLLKSISETPHFHEAYCRLAELYFKQNAPQKAISILKEALSSDPGSPQIANNLAWLYLEHQPEDINEAMRLAQLAYEKLPENAAVADTLGWIYFKKKMPTRAVWLLEEALSLNPDNPLINFHLGMTLLADGKKMKARQYLTRSLDLGLDSQLLQVVEKILANRTPPK